MIPIESRRTAKKEIVTFLRKYPNMSFTSKRIQRYLSERDIVVPTGTITYLLAQCVQDGIAERFGRKKIHYRVGANDCKSP